MTADQGDLLRSMVREVLRDVLPGIVADSAVQRMATGATSSAPSTSPAAATDGREPVVLRTDADLDAFVQRLLRMAENPVTRHHLKSGRIRFGLNSAPSVVTTPTTAAVSPHHIGRGALTERHVRAAAAAGQPLVIASGVVVTPLARDRARALGVEITKEQQR